MNEVTIKVTLFEPMNPPTEAWERAMDRLRQSKNVASHLGIHRIIKDIVPDVVPYKPGKLFLAWGDHQHSTVSYLYSISSHVNSTLYDLVIVVFDRLVLGRDPWTMYRVWLKFEFPSNPFVLRRLAAAIARGDGDKTTLFFKDSILSIEGGTPLSLMSKYLSTVPTDVWSPINHIDQQPELDFRIFRPRALKNGKWRYWKLNGRKLIQCTQFPEWINPEDIWWYPGCSSEVRRSVLKDMAESIRQRAKKLLFAGNNKVKWWDWKSGTMVISRVKDVPDIVVESMPPMFRTIFEDLKKTKCSKFPDEVNLASILGAIL